MLLSSPAGNDILFDESQVEQGRNFCNKLWNAWRLISGWEVVADNEVSDAVKHDATMAGIWFQNRLNQALESIHADFREYRLSDALMAAYKLVWDDYCAWYLEMVKPVYGQPIHQTARDAAREYFAVLMRLLHPFMPFITEELYHAVYNAKPEKPCILSDYPIAASWEKTSERPFRLISEIRQVRNSKGISPREPLQACVLTAQAAVYEPFAGIISRLANCTLTINGAKPEPAAACLVETDELFVSLPAGLNIAEERAAIHKELAYLEGFLKSVDAKLGNERFVANAKPDVVEKEKQKKADAVEKISNLRETLKTLEAG
jgi:valyl-tRNA synthetase